MVENISAETATVRDLKEVLKEVETAVLQKRSEGNLPNQRIIDLRWKFDQISAKMNQAIYNNQTEETFQHCLDTVAVLIEILSRK
jgi:hypothetical protein